MALHDVLGQEHAVQVLRKTLESSRVAQAYLFYGPAGVGKKFTAWQFSKALYCLSPSPDACESCSTCHKIANGNHPDVLLITPADTSIKIEQIRSMQHRLGYKPYEGPRVTVLIDSCELLTLPAANALLKTLEEPPHESVVVLISGNKEALPVTIVSRCQPVPFTPLAPTHIETLLIRQGVDTDTARLAASLSEGRLKRFSQGDFEQLFAVRQSAYTALQGLLQRQDVSLFLRARQLAGKRDQCEELLHWLTLFLRDLTMLKIAPAPEAGLYNRDLHETLVPLARRLRLESLLDAFAVVQQLRTALSLNSNPQLVFEQLVIQCQQTFAQAAASHS
jgi:DNA polymerase-3 subunit delta'